MKWLEIERIRAVYRKREVMKTTVYNPLDPGAFYLLTSRDRYMVRILRTFLTPTRTLQEIRILDVGCGDGGVLRRLVLLGARPENLCGIDLLEEHIQHAQQVTRIFASLWATPRFYPSKTRAGIWY